MPRAVRREFKKARILREGDSRTLGLEEKGVMRWVYVYIGKGAEGEGRKQYN